MVEIIKTTGEKESFEREKFCDSLRRAGAPQDITEDICARVAGEVTPGMSTSQIFRKASKYLMKKNLPAGIRYNVKRGVELLGPAGFLFEQFVEVLLRGEGFEKTARDQMIRGECVEHEVDVVGEKGGERYIVEVKYHGQSVIKTPVDVVMYADARREDIGRAEAKQGNHIPHRLLLVTNTKFSGNAVAYAHCRTIGLLGWQYPRNRGLEDIIRENMLYPTTVLPSVDRGAREVFARHDMMLVRDLAPYSVQDVVHKFGIDERRARGIIKEAHMLVYGKEHTD